MNLTYETLELGDIILDINAQHLTGNIAMVVDRYYFEGLNVPILLGSKYFHDGYGCSYGFVPNRNTQYFVFRFKDNQVKEQVFMLAKELHNRPLPNYTQAQIESARHTYAEFQALRVHALQSQSTEQNITDLFISHDMYATDSLFEKFINESYTNIDKQIQVPYKSQSNPIDKYPKLTQEIFIISMIQKALYDNTNTTQLEKIIKNPITPEFQIDLIPSKLNFFVLHNLLTNEKPQSSFTKYFFENNHKFIQSDLDSRENAIRIIMNYREPKNQRLDFKLYFPTSKTPHQSAFTFTKKSRTEQINLDSTSSNLVISTDHLSNNKAVTQRLKPTDIEIDIDTLQLQAFSSAASNLALPEKEKTKRNATESQYELEAEHFKQSLTQIPYGKLFKRKK